MLPGETSHDLSSRVRRTKPEARHRPACRRPYNPSIGYLPAFITLLVLAHHAVLAYHPFAPAPGAALNGPARWWPAFPVVDSQRWTGSAVFVGFNDIFFYGSDVLL
ncbi:MAG TPA: hypothetical protein VIX37_00095 [Candidatus Sulfotelmatobacter sp.]